MSGYTSVLEMKAAAGDNIGHYGLYIICRLLLGDCGSRGEFPILPKLTCGKTGFM